MSDPTPTPRRSPRPQPGRLRERMTDLAALLALLAAAALLFLLAGAQVGVIATIGVSLYTTWQGDRRRPPSRRPGRRRDGDG
ncbi:hypothetical protein OH807_39080 [Kitasatospora sp. NBC_01560]|uniref:hypothetical protein n=1 Tax=Kitasatospora sp. NBC_01560 TaxID=2975965 RepID=UPI003868ECED